MSSKPMKHYKRLRKSFEAKDPVLHNYRFEDSDETYYCNECDYSTQIMAYVRQHMISHSNERPFVCDYEHCDQSYKRSNELKRHIDVFHKGIKQYVCDICGKGLTQSGALKDHKIAIHLKVKSYFCGIDGCKKSFSLPRNLRQHQKRRHNKNNVNEDNETDDEYKDETDEENDFKNNKYKTRANSSVSNGHKNGFTINCRQSSHEINTSKSPRNGFKNSLNQELSPIKNKRNHDKKNDKNENNNYLFECNFIGCEFNTYVWEQIADHFVDHWENSLFLTKSKMTDE